MRTVFALLTLAALLTFTPRAALAHCDTLSGPVITDARAALAAGSVTPVLKWIKPEHEQEVRAAFHKTLAVRSLSPEAESIADQYFFETLVRLHRAGEGEPFTGLKSEKPEPLLVQADKALASGSSEGLIKEVTAHVSAEMRQRVAAAVEARRHADESVSAGREYVARYVELMHYIERLHGGEAKARQDVAHQH